MHHDSVLSEEPLTWTVISGGSSGQSFLGLGFSKNLSWLRSPLQLAIDSQITEVSTCWAAGKQTCAAGGDHRVPTQWQHLHFSLYFFCKRTKISTLLFSIKVYFSSILDFLVTSLVMRIWPLRLQREHRCSLRTVGFCTGSTPSLKRKELLVLPCSMAI